MHTQDNSTWQGKALYRWSMDEMLHFFKTEVGVENKVGGNKARGREVCTKMSSLV